MSRIEVRDVRRSYGAVTALDGVSLSIDAGETFGLVGTNGAGKTTLFKHLVGHETPDSGEVTVAGRSPEQGPAVRRRVGYLPEDSGFPPNRTGREVLAFHATVRGVDDLARRVERVLHTVGLADDADRRVGSYSNGMNRRLGLGTTLLGDPAVLLLDEPTAGLDPQGVEAFHEIVERVARETDLTLVVSSHVLPEIERLCDRVAVLDDGRVVAAGTVAELREAADESVTVTARLADGGDVEALADAAATVDDVESVRRIGPRRLSLTCDRAAAYDVVSYVHERTTLAGFEVREPGLDAAFDEFVDGTDAVNDVGVQDGSTGGESS